MATFSFGASAQNVNIPDANFKAYLVGNTAINTNGDTEIQVSEATAYTGQIACSNLGITDMTGLEAFTNITILQCIQNTFTSLDVSQNTALTLLNCQATSITSIDVSQNTALQYLYINNTGINNIDLSQNTALLAVQCHGINLSSLDVSQNPNLSYLKCDNNNLTVLDVSQNPNLSNLRCEGNNLTELNMKNVSTTTLTTFNATSNPNLTCIDVDDVNLATAAWTNIDATASFSLNCNSIPVSSITVQGQGGASTISVQGGTLQMEAVVMPANADDPTYTWSVTNGTGSATIDVNGVLTAAADGTVTVTATANDGSGVTGTAVVTISNQSVGVDEQGAIHNLSIYPNPASSLLYVHADERIEQVTILDVLGGLVRTSTLKNGSIDLSDLRGGVYFLQIQTDKGSVVKRIVKE